MSWQSVVAAQQDLAADNDDIEWRNINHSAETANPTTS